MKDWQIALCVIALVFLMAQAYALYFDSTTLAQQRRDYGEPYNPCDGVLDKQKHSWCPQ